MGRKSNTVDIGLSQRFYPRQTGYRPAMRGYVESRRSLQSSNSDYKRETCSHGVCGYRHVYPHVSPPLAGTRIGLLRRCRFQQSPIQLGTNDPYIRNGKRRNSLHGSGRTDVPLRCGGKNEIRSHRKCRFFNKYRSCPERLFRIQRSTLRRKRPIWH